MSMVEMVEVTCPVCGKKSDFSVWKSVNTMLDPEAKAALLSGELFRFVCKHCAHTAQVVYSMLFHDAEHQTMLYLAASGDEENIRQGLEQAEKAVDTLRGIRKRIVSDLETLREKIMIFDLGLDDREVELTKLFFYQKIMKQNPELQLKKILFQYENGQCFLSFVGDTPLQIPIPAEVFRSLPSPLKVDGQDGALVVDALWALEYLKSHI